MRYSCGSLCTNGLRLPPRSRASGCHPREHRHSRPGHHSRHARHARHPHHRRPGHPLAHHHAGHALARHHAWHAWPHAWERHHTRPGPHHALSSERHHALGTGHHARHTERHHARAWHAAHGATRWHAGHTRSHARHPSRHARAHVHGSRTATLAAHGSARAHAPWGSEPLLQPGQTRIAALGQAHIQRLVMHFLQMHLGDSLGSLLGLGEADEPKPPGFTSLIPHDPNRGGRAEGCKQLFQLFIIDRIFQILDVQVHTLRCLLRGLKLPLQLGLTLGL
mmetsp:Transcript_27616/g.62594  ORF Transcript_27616/g.62594 Transcript_27616/m.62594 type:complete len:279 (-) Transcript_27616:1084-1920(-)